MGTNMEWSLNMSLSENAKVEWYHLCKSICVCVCVCVSMSVYIYICLYTRNKLSQKRYQEIGNSGCLWGEELGG